MLSLRLVLGAGPLTHVRRSLVAIASAGAGFLLLCSLGYALGHPDDRADALARLLWCFAPLATTVQLASAVGRVDTILHPAPGLAGAGCGPYRHALLTAASTALICFAGSVLALVAFLSLRGSIVGSPLDDPIIDAFAVGHRLPVGAVLTLLSVAPLAAAATSAFSLRTPRTTDARRAWTPRSARPALATQPAAAALATNETSHTTRTATSPFASMAAPLGQTDRVVPAHHGADTGAPSTAPPASPELVQATNQRAPHVLHTAPPPSPTEASGLPWGIALISVGLALEAYVSRDATDTRDLLPTPGHLSGGAIAVLATWVLATAGLVLVGPGLIRLCGRLLALGRPGAMRLLAGRGLQEESNRLGRPLGALCAVASSTYVAVRLYDAVPDLTHDRPFGPLTGLGAALVMGCATATALMAVLESKNARIASTDALIRIGAPRSVLRNAATLRVTAVVTVLGALSWLVAELAAMPLAT
ncbi:hypothetical protein H8N00_08985 [Streptomyces sp. AC563]|uniref:hypothetical protein n=1 Tax=Streptomyces buecherae TaxID=2763006 RepID=UPI00164D1B09|nr:hypothetical protein [Streptomyces buecherae]MBC3989013.1 hypothetical protein [Streptomyces buecherae]